MALVGQLLFFIVFAIIIALLIWAVASFIPTIQEQLTSFVENLPSYVRSINVEANKFLESPWLANYQEELEEMLSNVSTKAIDYAESFSKMRLTGHQILPVLLLV